MKTHTHAQALVLALCCTLVFTQEVGNIVEVADASGSFSTLVGLVAQAGLAGVLSGDGPLTVFAPTDEAFAAVGDAALNALKSNPKLLKSVLLYHVVQSELYASNLTDGDVLASAQGELLRVNVFPTILQTVVTVNGAQVMDGNIEASNGVIHAIDRVLLIPQGDVTEVLVSDGRFSTLVTAVTTAGLLGTLQSEGPFTVFAPTNDAFDLLPSGTLDNLLEDPETLSDVLLRHVVGTTLFYKVFPADITTVNNETLTVTFNSSIPELFISSDQGQARISDFDLVATNGVIHVIDAVI